MQEKNLVVAKAQGLTALPGVALESCKPAWNKELNNMYTWEFVKWMSTYLPLWNLPFVVSQHSDYYYPDYSDSQTNEITFKKQ